MSDKVFRLMNERQRLVALYDHLELLLEEYFSSYDFIGPQSIGPVRGLDLASAIEDLYNRIEALNKVIMANTPHSSQ